MITRDEAIEIARGECQRQGWPETPPFDARSGREFLLWGKTTWFVVTNAGHQGDNAYIHIDGDTGEITGAAFAAQSETDKRRGIWKL